MPINLPTVTTNDISFGPAVIFLGASGATPTVDIGAIGEGGPKISVTAEKREIRQGNSSLVEYAFTKMQDAVLDINGIEWEQDNFLYAIGAGNTTVSASEETLRLGGDPVIEFVALHTRHRMAVPGHTMNVYLWKAFASGNLDTEFSLDEHTFPYQWKGMRSATRWGGGTLASDEQLIEFHRQIT